MGINDFVLGCIEIIARVIPEHQSRFICVLKSIITAQRMKNQKVIRNEAVTLYMETKARYEIETLVLTGG
jgi:hypothetical protein